MHRYYWSFRLITRKILPQLVLVLTGVFWSHDSTALSLDRPGLDVEWLESLALHSALSKEPKDI